MLLQRSPQCNVAAFFHKPNQPSVCQSNARSVLVWRQFWRREKLSADQLEFIFLVDETLDDPVEIVGLGFNLWKVGSQQRNALMQVDGWKGVCVPFHHLDSVVVSIVDVPAGDHPPLETECQVNHLLDGVAVTLGIGRP